MSFYAADGSMNVTVVDSSNTRGVYAADGSINVSTSGTFGAYDATGAWRVTYTASPVNTLRAPDQSLYVTTSPYQKGARKVTVVSGSFGSSFLLLADGVSFLLLTNGTDRLILAGPPF